MKTLSAIVAAALATATLLASTMPPRPPQRSDFQPESRIWIDGTSSVHDWTCEVSAFDGFVESDSAENGQLIVRHAEVRVPVEEIECNNGTMNKKTRKALKADQYPMISFIVDTMDSPADSAGGAVVTGRLKIAGEQRAIKFQTLAPTRKDGQMTFNGEVPLLMSDFNVKPPTAMLGVLKTGNEVTVRFEVIATASTDLRVPN